MNYEQIIFEYIARKKQGDNITLPKYIVENASSVNEINLIKLFNGIDKNMFENVQTNLKHSIEFLPISTKFSENIESITANICDFNCSFKGITISKCEMRENISSNMSNFSCSFTKIN